MEDKKLKIKEYLGTETVNPLLTDFYQFTMMFAYWKNGRKDDNAVFDLYFRKCPFNLNYCLFGGVDECFEFLSNFKFTDDHLKYLKTQLPQADEEFFTYLSNLDMSEVKIYGFNNAEFVLPNEPLLTLEGPLAKIQLIETTLLNLTNYPSLILSLSSKLRSCSNFKNKLLFEDGSICAQSPNGAVMGVKYSLLGGVNQTTNLLASKLFGLDLLTKTPLIDSEIDCDDLLLTEEDFILNDVDLLKLIQKRITDEEYNKLKTRIFRVLYPAVSSFQSNKFTFDITNKDNLKEDLLLFALCTNALYTENNNNFKFMLFLNYSEAIDNVEDVRKMLEENFCNLDMKDFINNPEFLLVVRYTTSMLKEDYTEVSPYFQGILLGPEFIVSYTQPALGMVYKLNQINGTPCIKFSEEIDKQTIPGFKVIIRLFKESGESIGDFMCLKEEADHYLNMQEIEAYYWNEFSTKVKVTSHSNKIMNNLLFDNGKIVSSGILNFSELKNKVLHDTPFYQNQKLDLYLSEGIRKIIVEATQKKEEIVEK